MSEGLEHVRAPRPTVAAARRVSIRARITFWFALALAVLAVGGSLSAYLIVRSQLGGQAADAARALARAAAAVEPDELPLDRLTGADDRVWLLDAEGRVVAASYAAGGRTAADVAAAVANALSGGPPAASARAPRAEGGVAVALVVDRASARTLSDLRRTLILIGLGGLAVAILLGALLSARVLRPVEKMRAAADAIPGDELDRRLPAGRDDELGRLAGAFNRLLGRVERASREQERFVADASHELRTPITALEGHARIAARALERGETERARESLAVVRAEARRLGLTLQDLLSLAEAGGAPAPAHPVRLDEAVAEAAEEMRALAPYRDLEQELAPVTVLGDRGRVQELARILIDNALKYSPEGSPVVVRVADGARPSLTVRDRGPGLAEGERARAFDRFYRGEAARGVAGSGLGLAIARAICERHGADLRLEPAPGGGTLAVVRFPPAGGQAFGADRERIR